MRTFRRHPLLVPALLCAFAGLAARPADVMEDGMDASVSTQVARLYADAAVATREYESGRREAEARRAEVERLEGLLKRERQEIEVLREDLGRIARAQYRTSGGLPVAARMVLADDPQEMLRGQHAVWKAQVAVDHAVGQSRRAEAALAADEAEAAAAWQSLEKRNAELAELKRGIERKLEEARSRLQGQGDASVAAGACRGAERLDQPEARFAGEWVAPVETYELSAGFGSGGSRWVHRHTGQDFAVPIGTPVRAVGAGRVVRVSCGGPFGIEAVVQHADGYYTQYAHLASAAVDQGEQVSAGQWIGLSGTTGNSTGPHLHFEVRVTSEAGSALDPEPWLAERGVELGQE